MEAFIVLLVVALIVLTAGKIAYDEGYKAGIREAFAEAKAAATEAIGRWHGCGHPEYQEDVTCCPEFPYCSKRGAED